MRTTLALVCTALVAIQAEATPQSQVWIATSVAKLCLTVGSDSATLQAFACMQMPQQTFDYAASTGVLRSLGKCVDAVQSSNGNALQVQPCSQAPQQTWTFGADGRIQSRTQVGMCLGRALDLGTKGSGSMMFLEPCATAVAWAIATTLPFQAVAPPPLVNAQQQLPSLQQQPPMLTGTMQQAVQPLPLYSPPPQQQQQQQPPMVEAGNPSAADHFLCVCIVDKDAGACNQAARAACQIGHLPAASCAQSFGQGKHDMITNDILRLIENGARCSTFDPATLKNEAAMVGASSSDGTPGVNDHYLCVCLEDQGVSTQQKCQAAVRAACLVGHIPAGDCEASQTSSGNLAGVTNHVLRLIDQGANCKNKLQVKSSPTCAKPPCFGATKSRFWNSGSNLKNSAKALSSDLCTCLDDPEASVCLKAMAAACTRSDIPKEDCQVMKGGKYMAGVTRHALRLIDHGANCPAHRAMSFTNRGCHCLQSWTEGARTLTFPNNCADPGGKKGFAWCKTYANEGCKGVDGDTTWDRCDSPLLPIRRSEVGGAQSGAPTEDDHYLCVCVDDSASDEVCVAAVRAACQVGHLPSAACAESLGKGQHASVSNEVVALVKNGARCSQFDSASLVPGGAGGKFCGKGRPAASGCECFAGYSGPTCEKCDDGFVGFPSCRPKKECDTPCTNGLVCDYMDGTCVEPPEDTWTVGQGLLYLTLFGGLLYAAYLTYVRWRAGKGRAVAYSALHRDDDDLGGVPTHVSPPQQQKGGGGMNGHSVGGDFGSPPPELSVRPVKATVPVERNGLAV